MLTQKQASSLTCRSNNLMFPVVTPKPLSLKSPQRGLFLSVTLGSFPGTWHLVFFRLRLYTSLMMYITFCISLRNRLNSPIPVHFSNIHSCHLLFDHFQFALTHGLNIPGPYAILLFTALDFTVTTSHIHN